MQSTEYPTRFDVHQEELDFRSLRTITRSLRHPAIGEKLASCALKDHKILGICATPHPEVAWISFADSSSDGRPTERQIRAVSKQSGGLKPGRHVNGDRLDLG
jgi:hypothetical protein